MLTGVWLLVALIVSIIVMIFMISKLKVHPFLAILTVSTVLALFSLPIDEIPGTINAGFGGTASMALCHLGSLIGFVIEKTGAPIKIADVVNASWKKTDRS